MLAERIAVTFRTDPDSPECLWSNHHGPLPATLRAAQRLLIELREVHPGVVVRIDGVPLQHVAKGDQQC